MDNLLLYEKDTFTGLQAYKNSKLANIMFTYELARKLEGTGVTATCVCPGTIDDSSFLILSISSKIEKRNKNKNRDSQTVNCRVNHSITRCKVCIVESSATQNRIKDKDSELLAIFYSRIHPKHRSHSFIWWGK